MARKDGQMAFCSIELHPIKALGVVEEREFHGHRASTVALETVFFLLLCLNSMLFVYRFVFPLSTYLYIEYVNTSGGALSCACMLVSKL